MFKYDNYDMTTENIIQISLFMLFLIFIWILIQIDQYDSTIDIKSTEHMSSDCDCSDNLDIYLYNEKPVYTPYHNCMVDLDDSDGSNEPEELNKKHQHVHSMYNNYDKLLCC